MFVKADTGAVCVVVLKVPASFFCALIASLSLGVGYCVKLIPFDMTEKIASEIGGDYYDRKHERVFI